MSVPAPTRPFVFHDARGLRWKVVRVAVLLGCLVLFAAALVFARSLLKRPSLRLPSSVSTLRSQLRGLQHPLQDTRRAMRRGENPGLRHSLDTMERDRRRSATAAFPRPSKSITLGFLPEEDPAALAALRRAAPWLTHLCPRWITISNENLDLAFASEAETRRVVRQHDLKVIALLTNEFDGWRGDLIAGLVSGPEADRAAFIEKAVRLARSGNCEGIAVDFEEVDAGYADSFNEFLVRFAARCHEERLLFMVCVPVGWDALVFDLDLLVEHADYLIAMLCNENSRHDPLGALASQPWFERWLHRMLEFGRPGQWIAAIGNFGCDWPLRGPVGREISFAEAMSLADSVEPVGIEWAETEANPTFSYSKDEEQHTVWFLDAATAFNQVRAARSAGVAGIGVWKLGSEDPDLWEALALARRRATSETDWAPLGRIDLPDHVVHVGEGEILRVHPEREPGHRAFDRLPNGRVRARYLDAPRSLRVEHGGVVAPNWVALTFDDGPDRRWTPGILDILKQEGVHATFFIVGSAAEKNPDLLVRMVREGHEVGVHTYTHPDLTETPRVQLDLELNATQRLIESLTGRSTILFRPPYSADSRPQTMAEIQPILRAQELGYLTLCENIDPRDWQRPGAAEILRRVKQLRSEGSVVLLHDGGGDRHQTVEALAPMIHWLRRSHHRPVRFVSASELAGVSHDQVMPLAPNAERGTIFATSFGLSVVQGFIEFIWSFLIVATVLVVFRSIAIAALALWQARRPAPTPPSTFPPVSVVIAAYNEERVIEAATRAVLDADYPGPLEVVVVDDGSSDSTASVISSAFAADPRVRLISQPNTGKAGALCAAIAVARHDILVSIDADTRIGRGALARLVPPLLADPNVGAVSGNARVGNRRRWLAKFQALEYTSGFNLDRRAFELLNCITVVPGAIGAYRREAIVEAGGFTSDTLAEDTDLTMQIRKDGWRVAYADLAIGWTECPETLRGLLRQRFRWAFGTLQCLWKHRAALFNPRAGTLGWIAMPSLWFFQIFLAATSPIVDLLVILSVLGGGGTLVLLFLLAFLLSDTLLAALALHLDGEPVRRALWILPQRFVYRPLLSIVVWGAFYRALRGALVSWGKVPRTATVRIDSQPGMKLLLGLSFLIATAAVHAQRLAVPQHGAYVGAYMDLGETEDELTPSTIASYEKLCGRRQAIVAFSSFWGQDGFPDAQVDAVRRSGAVPLIFWSPWGPPYRQNDPQPEYSLDRIIQGRFDSYIREWARKARETRLPLLVAFGLEMNGDWFPWGGPNHGGGETRGFGDPAKPDGPERFIAAYRRVVRLVRTEGALNVEWVYHAQNYSWPVAPWNTITAYYPGDDVVDWLGLSVYGKQGNKEGWLDFKTVMKMPFEEIARLNRQKPIMLAEWGVGEFPQEGSKAGFFDEAFASMMKDYPRLRAAVYWHERWQNADETWSNLRINSSPKSLVAFRRGMQLPFWIDRPVIVP